MASGTDCESKKTPFINDLDEGSTNNISKFADAMKRVGNVSSGKDIKMFPSDFSKLSEWVNAWQMQYNVANVKFTTLDGETEWESII